MLTIKGLYRKVLAFNTDTAIDNAFENTTPDLANINRKQLYAGFDKSGEKIKKRYGKGKYARVKHEMNPVPGLGVPDLYVTGDFHKGIKVDYSGGVLKTMSTDEKAKWLEPRYKPYGLGGTYKKEYIATKLRPALNSEISTGLGLKFNKNG